MALTKIQRNVCQLLAADRKHRGESYVAGGVALNTLIGANRRSRDLDLFHDTTQALQAGWDADRTLLLGDGYSVEVVRERPTFVEAVVRKAGEAVVLEWSQDSAFRFFPLIEHAELGLTLHPVDLATNKVLALVGRREPRDFVDVVHCDEQLQPLGYLAWAAAGKDPGFSPASILEEASRSVRYSQADLDALDFDGPSPNAAALSRRWHVMLESGRALVAALPSEHAGQCVLDHAGNLARNLPAPEATQLHFHAGHIRGAFPRHLRSQP